jgi:hypothetical protein
LRIRGHNKQAKLKGRFNKAHGQLYAALEKEPMDKSLLAQELAADNDAYAKSSEAAEDLEIAKLQARYAMKGAPIGMSHDDLLEVAVNVIVNERHGDGSRLHQDALANAIKRRLVRAIARLKRRRDPDILETRRANDFIPPTAVPEDDSPALLDMAIRGGRATDSSTGETADDSDWATRPSVLAKWKILFDSLSNQEKWMILALMSGWSQKRIAEEFHVNQSTISRLITRLTKDAVR